MGWRLNWHRAPVRLQLEQASGPFSLVASHRIYERYYGVLQSAQVPNYLLSSTLVACARNFRALPAARPVVIAVGVVFVEVIHDGLGHLLRRMRGPRRGLERVMRAEGCAHCMSLRAAVEQARAFLKLRTKVLLQSELSIARHMLLLVWRRSVLAHV